MRFKYIEATESAPKITSIYGYVFELNGECVEVAKEHEEHFKGLGHIGIVEAIKELSPKIESKKEPTELKKKARKKINLDLNLEGIETEKNNGSDESAN